MSSIAVQRAGTVRRVLQSDFVGHAGLVFVSQLALNFCNYLFHFAVSRRLGADGYGTLQSLLAITTLLSVLSGVLSLVVVKYVSELNAANDLPKVRWLVSRVMRWVTLIAVFSFFAIAASSKVLSSYFHVSDLRAFAFVGVFVGIYVVLPVLRSVLQGLQRFRAFAGSVIMEGVGKAALGIALTYAGFGVTGALGGATAAAIFALIYTLYCVYARMPRTGVPFAIDFRRLGQSAGGAAVATLALAVLSSVDMLMVKHYFSPHDAGIYAATSLVGRVLLFVVGFIPIVLLPKVTACAISGESPRKLLVGAGFLMLAISGCGLLALGTVPLEIVSIMAGGAFAGAARMLVYYGVAMTLLAGINLATTYKIGIHRFDFALPLLAIMSAEIVVMQFVHRTLMDIIWILIAGHTVALAACLYRIARPLSTSSHVPTLQVEAIPC